MSKSRIPSLATPDDSAQLNEDRTKPERENRPPFGRTGTNYFLKNIRQKKYEPTGRKPWLDGRNRLVRDTMIAEPSDRHAAEFDSSSAAQSDGNRYIYSPGHSRICGTGVYLPEERITTQDLLREIGTKSRFGIPYHWLERVTGIKEKRITPPGVLPSDMAVVAAKEAMERARVLPRQIDCIIYTGLTRDYLEPATAHVVQAKLGAMNAVVFDICNACHGFMNGIHMIDALIATGQITYGLVVTGEQGSLFARQAVEKLEKTSEHKDFVLHVAALTGGDAGAAMVIGRKVVPDSGFVGFLLQSQGQHWQLCTAGVPLGSQAMLTDMPIIVEETTKLVVKMFDDLFRSRLKWRVEDLAKLFIHQVGSRTSKMYTRSTGVPLTVMPQTVEVFGNLLTATIPLGIHLSSSELKRGDKIYISSTGSGISLAQAGLVWDTT
jgi:3-oxoacyl-[acyl-carrier-protein] synthase III